MVALVRCPRGCGPIPSPLERVPGPVILAAARYATSPVGPYLELAVAEPVRLGARIGTCVTVIVVDSAASRDAGRTRWGLPKELGTLNWSAQDDSVTLGWEERGVAVTGHPVGPGFPAVVPFRSLQPHADGPVRFGGLMRGWGRFSRVEVAVSPGDPLGALAGRHAGVRVTRGAVTMGRARPAGRAPE
ncbi:MAG TPA: acetoacetate decarboxylase family protein [Acidimicrobiales bacterium]|nr:acetoacetate decarboxylase family protein [Acidimicrobiales bacterium]